MKRTIKLQFRANPGHFTHFWCNNSAPVVDVDDAYFSEVGTGITPRGQSSFSQETEYMSRTSGVTIQHGVDVDDVQSSSENAKTPLLQLAQEISIAAYGSGASEQGSQDSSLKMHEANEARTLSLKTLEEVNPAQQYKEHSDVLFASTVHAETYYRSRKTCQVKFSS